MRDGDVKGVVCRMVLCRRKSMSKGFGLDILVVGVLWWLLELVVMEMFMSGLPKVTSELMIPVYLVHAMLPTSNTTF